MIDKEERFRSEIHNLIERNAIDNIGGRYIAIEYNQR